MRGDGVKADDKRPQPQATWQPPSDRLSAERKPNSKSKTRSPDNNLTSLYRLLRLHANQLFQSTKRSFVIAKQSAQQKFAAGAAWRKAKKETQAGRPAEETRRQAEEPARIRTKQERQQAEQARLKVEEETKRKAEGAGSQAEAQAGIEAEQERQQAEEARLQAEEETRRAEEARRHAEAQARIKAEQKRQHAEAEQARRKAEEEKRRAEEARRQAEAQARIKAEQERQQAQAEQARLQESLNDSETKHCPRCKRVFSSNRDYCLYDAAWLVSATDASLRPAVKQDATTGPVVWILVVITFLGAGILGLQISNYIPNGPPSDTSEETSESDEEQDQPVVGGMLNGKETILPNPDYPESAKREGVSGKVTVAVLVDRNGTVRSARALNGHPLLQVPAVAAARKAKFAPEKLTSRPPGTSGTITYNFKL